ncbi:hypothetical protein AVEN_77856-1 [Araneus ventricosus]|uniref:Uncharacterized protein n=1 Tax=Araneus ventricosus TaxID=182803 RepID=A0A4Y2Q1Z9_ARAVE|nr:hypothetical protein AVEN_77856-1 [Araneus ventricosus]
MEKAINFKTDENLCGMAVFGIQNELKSTPCTDSNLGLDARVAASQGSAYILGLQRQGCRNDRVEGRGGGLLEFCDVEPCLKNKFRPP